MASHGIKDAPAPAAQPLDGIVATLHSLPRRFWLDLIRADQSARWRAGNGLLAEEYFQALPELTAEHEEMLVLICGELQLRRERGQEPSLAEYQQRFSNLGNDLALQFEVERFLDSGSSDGELMDLEREPLMLPAYETLGAIGRGGSGVVYLCRQKSLDRLVAVKALGDSTPGSKHLARRRQEAEILSRLRLANVVHIYEVIQHEGRLHLVMEYIDGASLAERIDGKPVGPHEAAKLMVVLAQTIHDVHKAGILHRDLKPSNVLLTAEGQPKITDFGLAKLLSSDVQLTSEDSFLGTPSYMAPEQAAGGGQELGAETDVYALGAVLYELLTGRPPFLGTTLLETLSSIRERQPVGPRQLQPTVPRDLETICLKCLAKLPEQRYRTAENLAGDLRRYIEGRPILARRPSRLHNVWMWSRRNPALAIVSAELVLSVLVGFAGIAWKWRDAEHARQDAQTAREQADARADEIRMGMENLKAANAQLDRGRVYTEWTRWDDADAAFTAALSLRSDLAPAWAERGRLFAMLGLWDMAAADFAKLHELQAPALSRDWWHCALLLAHTGDEGGYQKLCQRMWERFAGTNATSFTVDLTRTLCLMPVNGTDPGKVVTLIEEAIGTSTTNSHGRLALVIACYRAGDFERSAGEGESLVELNSDEAAKLVLPVLAMAYQALGRNEEAQRTLNQASLIVEKSHAAVFERKSPNWVVDQGVVDSGSVTVWDWLEFLQYLREAQEVLGVSPPKEDARPLVSRARALAGLRRFVQADGEYAKALQLAPDEIQIQRETHRNRGYVFAAAGNFHKSAEEFGKASALDTNDSDLWRFYAAALAASGDMTAYRRVCRDMVHQFGQTTDRAQAYDVTHACVLLPDTLPDMSTLLPLAELASSWYVGARRIQGAACYRAGQYADALAMFDGAAKGQRFRAFDMCFVAMAHERLGNHEAARQHLAEAFAWMEAADAQSIDDLTGLQPHWGHWHERMDVRRLAAEASQLIEESASRQGGQPAL